jgi:hypothetical protein
MRVVECRARLKALEWSSTRRVGRRWRHHGSAAKGGCRRIRCQRIGARFSHGQRLGRIVNNNLAEYHVPVNADIPAIEMLFVEQADPHANPLGVKGLGEIGITGTAAAVANAVFHATGKRVRDLPITVERLL